MVYPGRRRDDPKPFGKIIALRALVNMNYVCAENNGNSALIANRTAIGLWEKFNWSINPNGTLTLQAAVNNAYVVAENAGSNALIANRGVIGPWEQFIWKEVN